MLEIPLEPQDFFGFKDIIISNISVLTGGSRYIDDETRLFKNSCGFLSLGELWKFEAKFFPTEVKYLLKVSNIEVWSSIFVLSTVNESVVLLLTLFLFITDRMHFQIVYDL